MARNKLNKRPSAAVAHDDDASKLSATNDASNLSFTSFTLPLFKKPRLAAPGEDLNYQQQMGCCTSKEARPENMQSEMDVDHSGGEPSGDSAASLPSTTPFLPYRSALMPTPEPEGAAEGFYSHPELLLPNHPEQTTPPTFPSPVTSSIAEHITEEHLDTTPAAESAGGLFWEMLHTDEMKDRLERFFINVFEVKPPMGCSVRSHLIGPYYRQGIMAGSIRTGEDLVVKQDNIAINVAAMQVSKEFQKAGSRLFYGRYIFYFNDPMNCKWWCKHIGELNLSNLRILNTDMCCGWPNLRTMDELCSIDQSDEELWYSFLSWFKTRHQLHNICVNFNQWKEVRKIVPWDSDLQDQLDHWREKIRTVLFQYRGLKYAEISDRHGLGLDGDRDLYMMMMVQSRASAFPPEPKQKLSLAQYLAKRKDELKMQAALSDDLRQEEKQRRKAEKGYHRPGGYAMVNEQEDEDENTEMGGFEA